MLISERELRPFITARHAEGFRIMRLPKSKHLKFRVLTPRGRVFLWVVSASPSDHRTLRNTFSDFFRGLHHAENLPSRGGISTS